MDGAKQCVKQHQNSTIDCIKWQIEPYKRMCIKPHKYNHALPTPSGRAWLRATNFHFSFPRDAGLQRFRTGLRRVPDAELAGEGAGSEQIVGLFPRRRTVVVFANAPLWQTAASLRRSTARGKGSRRPERGGCGADGAKSGRNALLPGDGFTCRAVSP